MNHFCVSIIMIVLANLNFNVLASPENDSAQPEDCNGASDCPKYHWCSVSLYSSECASHLKEGSVSCGKEENGVTVPDHEICRVKEAEDSGEDRGTDQYPSVSRCIAEIGYKCANSHYMPCPQSGCPVGFECKSVEFRDAEEDACVPRLSDFSSDACQSPLDCGYSDLINYWETCGPNKKCQYTDE